MLVCKEAIRLVSEQLDHKLTFWCRLSLRMHLLICRNCSRYMGQIEAIDKAIRDHYRCDGSLDGRPAHTPVERLPDDVLDRIKKSLRFAKHESDFPRDL